MSAWQVRFGALALIWGSSFLLIKYALAWFSPFQVGTFRIVLGALAVLLLLRISGHRLPRQRAVWGHLIGVSALLAAIPFVLFPLGEERVSSSLAGVANSATPLATVAATAIMLPHERLSGRQLAAVLLGFAGVVVVAQPWTQSGPDPLGFAIVSLASICYGVGWTWVRKYLSQYTFTGMQFPAAMLAVAAIELIVFDVVMWFVHGVGSEGADRWAAPWAPIADPQGPFWQPAAAIALLGLVGTGLAYRLQFDVVTAIGAQIASLVTFLIPIVAVVLGVLVLHERLTVWELVGAVTVLASGWLISRAPARPAAAARSADPSPAPGTAEPAERG